jgi:quinone-modifying oxidoreductase subunit QmoC
MAIRKNAVPGFLADIVGNPSMIIVALAVPIILFLVIIGSLGRLTIPEGEIVYAKMMPVPYIDAVFITSSILVTLSIVLSIKKFWAGLNGVKKAEGAFVPALIETIKEILTHKKFEKCGANKDRAWAHRLVFYGFIGLFITTNWAVFYLYILHWDSPYPQTNALKIFGNVSALTLLIGALMVVANRMKDKGVDSKSSSFDWVFAAIVLLVCVTGILSEVLRLVNAAQLAYPVYFVHLVFVFYIIAYLPFSKLSHLAYRTAAITYAKMAKRDVA